MANNLTLGSIITPTRNRPGFLQQLYQHIQAQTYPQWEWLIADDSPAPDPFFQTLSDSRIQYTHLQTPVSIGEKRNQLLSHSAGNWVVHMDDDDIYTPDYLATMAQRLQACDVTKLSAWHVYSQPHNFWGYFDPNTPSQQHFQLSPQESHVKTLYDFTVTDEMRWGYGFSYAYRKPVWKCFPFPDLSFGEDHRWMLGCVLPSDFKTQAFTDSDGLLLHVMHADNASEAFPNIHLSENQIPNLLQPYTASLKGFQLQ